MLSLSLITLTFIPRIFVLSPGQSHLVDGCSVISSAFIIILSLREGFKDFNYQAHVLRQAARDIQTIKIRTDRLISTMKEQLYLGEEEQRADVDQKSTENDDEFHKILRDCPFEASRADVLYVRARRPELFAGTRATTDRPRAILRFLDYMEARLLEFTWMLLPLTFLLGSIAIVYGVVAHDWPALPGKSP